MTAKEKRVIETILEDVGLEPLHLKEGSEHKTKPKSVKVQKPHN